MNGHDCVPTKLYLQNKQRATVRTLAYTIEIERMILEIVEIELADMLEMKDKGKGKIKNDAMRLSD